MSFYQRYTACPSTSSILHVFVWQDEAEELAAQACYIVRDAACSLWECVEGRSKDYIAAPKPNGYQSLHSTMRCVGLCCMRVQACVGAEWASLLQRVEAVGASCYADAVCCFLDLLQQPTSVPAYPWMQGAI